MHIVIFKFFNYLEFIIKLYYIIAIILLLIKKYVYLCCIIKIYIIYTQYINKNCELWAI